MQVGLSQITHDEIAQVAYRHWEQDGRPEGRDREYWLEAEQQLKATMHLLLTEQTAVRPAAPPANRAARPAANGNGPAVAAKPKARQGAARPALAKTS